MRTDGWSSAPPHARPAIGMLTVGPLLEMCEKQWLGVVDGARANDCDLVCFVGRELGHPDAVRTRANAIYDLASRHPLDAIVMWTNRLGLLVDDEVVERFLERFASVPIVSVERPLPGRPAVLLDNRIGMAAVVGHLVECHGLRRIAYINGPTNHAGSGDRLQGYLDALRSHGVPYDPALVTPPLHSWSPDEAAHATRALMTRLNAPPEAIAAANDDLALGVMSVLEELHLRTPDDVAVVGFDDYTNVRSHDLGYEPEPGDALGTPFERVANVNAGTPPITTARAPFPEMGRRAVDVALAMIRGEPVSEVEIMPTHLVVRRSCGCFPAPATRPPKGANLRDPTIVAREMRAALGDVKLPEDWAETLITTLVEEMSGREPPGRFLPLLDGYLRASTRAGCPPARWWSALRPLRRIAFFELSPSTNTEIVDELWTSAQLLLTETMEKIESYRHLLAEKRDQVARAAGQRFIAARDLSELHDALVDELPRLGIPGCQIVAHASADLTSSEASDATDRVVFRYERGATDRASSIVAVPLFSAEEDLGHAIFELGPRIGWIYEALQEHLGSALRGVLMVQRERRALAAVEDGRRRLELAHAELEQRVDDRTAELAKANEILTEHIAEREEAERRQASLESQLRHAQKMEAIGRLAGGIAHDFNNLLVVISGNTDGVLRRLSATDPMRSELEDIRHAGDRAANLTRQLLAFSHQQVLHPQAININDVLTSVQTMLQRLIGEDIRLTTRLSPDLARVWADAGQLEQIVFNIAVNARDAMAAGGELLMETRDVDGASMDTETRQRKGLDAGEYVLLRVQDTGDGMSDEVLARVFEPFFTTKPLGKGTGLGLATVFGIVQQSAGKVVIDSAVGQGTTVEIYLPRSYQESIDTGRASPDSPQRGSETILLVEDDEQVRSTVRRFLVRAGYHVLEAADGHDALRITDDHPGPIHLVVTDVVMPNLSGPDFASRLVARRPGTAVLYMSGYTESTVLRERFAGATVALIDKPFTGGALVQRVREVLDATGRPGPDLPDWA